MPVAHHKIVQLMQIKFSMSNKEFKKELTDFSKQKDELITEDRKIKSLIKGYKRVISEQRETIKELINNPLTIIFMWIKNRGGVKK